MPNYLTRTTPALRSKKERVSSSLQATKGMIGVRNCCLRAGVAISVAKEAHGEAGGKTIAIVPIKGNITSASACHLHIGRRRAACFRALWVGGCEKHREQKSENTQKVLHGGKDLGFKKYG
jgi:hypothetical protein